MGIRVLKTAVAVVAAVYLASLLQLNYTMSAGLLAILGVDVTKKKTMWNAFSRTSASILGMLLAAVIFYLLGYQIWVLALFILITYPILARLNLKEGIVTSSVIVLHVFEQQSIAWHVLFNESGLLVVGLGCAMVINMIYMPKMDHKLENSKVEVESLFSTIFIHISKHLKQLDYVWSGAEILSVQAKIDEAVILARKSYENSLLRGKTDWNIYFRMRKQQLESITRMMSLLSQVFQKVAHGELIAQVFVALSQDVKNEYYTGTVEMQLNQLEKKFKTMELPATREEFEVRAALLQLIVELRHFLSFAKKGKKFDLNKFF